MRKIVNELSTRTHKVLPLASPEDVEQFVMPETLVCRHPRNAGRRFRPAAIIVSAPGIIQTWCPLCDAHARVGGEPGYNYRQPAVHCYELRPRTALARLMARLRGNQVTNTSQTAG